MHGLFIFTVDHNNLLKNKVFLLIVRLNHFPNFKADFIQCIYRDWNKTNVIVDTRFVDADWNCELHYK